MDIAQELYNGLPWEATDHDSKQIAQLCYVEMETYDGPDLPDELVSRVGRGLMFVQFSSAKPKPSIYVYFDVPREAYNAVQGAAESPGRALNFAIKGHFEYERLHVED